MYRDSRKRPPSSQLETQLLKRKRVLPLPESLNVKHMNRFREIDTTLKEVTEILDTLSLNAFSIEPITTQNGCEIYRDSDRITFIRNEMGHVNINQASEEGSTVAESLDFGIRTCLKGFERALVRINREGMLLNHRRFRIRSLRQRYIDMVVLFLHFTLISSR
eukprot:TRINITY_DN91449_c0_g1_i1.p1 TRINITY_DN91449_c0_g1~~TRINITY_DN91449_c0_g1_i1.p1  ORF type:complete len:163 (+),score=26.83 TRINITY_DN91449_c0_g1_i1:142-630(+)